MCDILTWENIDNDRFSVFIRDLSTATSTNIRHMIEGMIPEPSENPKQKLKQKKQTKKEKIIEENNKRLQRRAIDTDKRFLHYTFENLDSDNPYGPYLKLTTHEMRVEYKMRMLKHFWKKKNRKQYLYHAINLFYHVKDSVNLDEAEQLFLAKIQKSLNKYEIKGYMLEKMGHMLPPLDFWDRSRTLDNWQRDVINLIRNKESILVRAPTSSGKTFVAMATGVIHGKILYVCPAKPVVYQVGSQFVKMGYRVHYLVENHSHFSYDKSTNIFIGVPSVIEESLPKIGLDYSYAVFDEIHTLNDYHSGICYENLIRLLKCPFLALSATVQNIEFLREIFKKHTYRPVHYIEYKHRFINQQRWVYDHSQDKLSHVHPLSCFDGGVGSLKDISMTPHDMISLYRQLEEIFEETSDGEIEELIDELDPEEFFSEKGLLSLDDTQDYEEKLKESLMRIHGKQPQELLRVVDSYKRNIDRDSTLDDIVPFLKNCGKKDLFPMLYFHTSSETIREIYMHIYEDLQKREIEMYPFHYKILEKKDELYRECMDKRERFISNLKIRGSDSRNTRQGAIDKFDRTQRNHFISSVAYYYDWCIQQCSKQGEHLRGDQVKNLQREKRHFMDSPDFRCQDIFQKHPEYCFTKGEPMSGQEIRTIKKEIKSTASITIDYGHPLFQLLKRGVGVYLDTLPDEYNRIVQRLMSHKRLGVILSDKTLCLGIDLPIRSVAFSGYKGCQYSPSDYIQMSGRAGRRGHDNQGNIIFHNVANYLDLMKGEHPCIVGSTKPIYSSYNSLKELSKNRICLDPLYTTRINSEAIHLKNASMPWKDDRMFKISWLLRYHKTGDQIVNSLNSLEKRVFLESEDQRVWFVLNDLCDKLCVDDQIVMAIKSNRLIQDMDRIMDIVETIGNVCRYLVNTLNPVTFKLTIHALRVIFDKCRTLLYKYRF